jgi:hypothetical protein
MSKLPPEHDEEHWQRCANEARRIADALDDPVAKSTMREIARSYERLASLAKKWRNSIP